MEVPTFRYMTDAEKFIKEISREVDESTKLLKKQQQLAASSLSSLRLTAATIPPGAINLGPSSRSEQLKLIRKHKFTIDHELQKIVVPSMQKLEKQYNMAENFYEKLKAVEQAETQVQMAFPDRRGTEYNALMTQFATLKQKIQAALKDCLQFLADVAAKHVPPSFQKYIDLVVDHINEHVIFREASTFMYVSVDPKGNLVFTAYIMLQDVANDEGEVAPHLYISIQWVNSKENTVNVDLNHEYEVPNKLLGQGESVGSVNEAVRAISTQLELENFSSTLGVVPLALQLNVDPTSINLDRFNVEGFKAKDVFSDFNVDLNKNAMTFTFRKEMKNPEAITEVNAWIYKCLKAMLKKNGARLSMRPDMTKKPPTVTFTVVKPAEAGEFSQFDFEYLRDQFGLNNTQLRKIHHIINQPKKDE